MKSDPKPVMSHIASDGSVIETLYDRAEASTAFAVGRPDGSIEIAPHIDLPNGERLVPYSGSNNLLTTGCVLLPSEVGEVGDKGDVLQAISDYLARYVELSPAFAEIVPYYVLLTWVYDAFSELGYLRFRGDYGCGKTRALLTVGSICYKPFFASGASTISPIFHILDGVRGVLVLDEADFRFSDMTGELTKVLNNGTTDGLPVLRTMSNRHRELSPQAFRVFGPKLVAMRERFADHALESRFLTEEMARRPLSPHIPIHTPAALRDEAETLRNRLLAWRLATRHLIRPDPSAAIAGASPRMNQMALALLSLVDDEAVRARIGRHLIDTEDELPSARTSPDMLVLAALAGAFAERSGPVVKIADIAQRYNEQASQHAVSPMTNKWVGTIIRTKLGISTIKSHGTFGVPASELERVTTLAKRFSIGGIETSSAP